MPTKFVFLFLYFFIILLWPERKNMTIEEKVTEKCFYVKSVLLVSWFGKSLGWLNSCNKKVSCLHLMVYWRKTIEAFSLGLRKWLLKLLRTPSSAHDVTTFFKCFFTLILKSLIQKMHPYSRKQPPDKSYWKTESSFYFLKR